MDRTTRIMGGLFINAALAQFGGTAVEFVFRRVRSTCGFHSRSTLVISDILFAVVAAFIIALLAHLTINARMAQWTWIPFVIWFAYGAAEYVMTPSSSIMMVKSFWPHFSGLNCAIKGGPASCYDFFIFSVPVLRGLSYSGAIWMWQQSLPKLKMRFSVGFPSASKHH